MFFSVPLYDIHRASCGFIVADTGRDHCVLLGWSETGAWGLVSSRLWKRRCPPVTTRTQVPYAADCRLAAALLVHVAAHS